MDNCLSTAAYKHRKAYEMKTFMSIVLTLQFVSCVLAQSTSKPPLRAVVAGVVNSSKDRHTIMLQTTADALRMEFTKNGTYEVVPWSEVEHVAKLLKMQNPQSEDDYIAIAKKADAQVVVVGEIKTIEIRTRD